MDCSACEVGNVKEQRSVAFKTVCARNKSVVSRESVVVVFKAKRELETFPDGS